MTQSKATHDAIVAANDKFMTTFSQGDAATMATLYTENGQMLIPNSDFVTGRQAIQSAFKGLMDSGIKSIKVATLEIEDYGETAYEVGKYTLLGENSQELDQGKYLVIWKQEDGQWKLHRDMINSSLPAQN